MGKDEQLFHIGVELAEALLLQIRQRAISGNLNYRRAMLFFFCKAFKSYQAIQLLWREGFREDAYVLARTIYELRLQAMYLSQDPEGRSMLFIRHWFKAGFGTLQLLKRIAKPEWADGIEQGAQEMRKAAERFGCADILENSDAEQAERAISQKWWGKGIKGLAKDLGLENEVESGARVQEYDLIYSQLSDYTHSGPMVLHMFLQISESSIKMLYKPAKDSRLTLPFSVTDWLTQIVGYTGRAFEIADQLDPLVYLAQSMAKAIQQGMP
jgi:hypothetical protein